ncbi:hypothetical protein [Rhodoglobus aureus]
MAKSEGGPDALIEKLLSEGYGDGFSKGAIVAGVVTAAAASAVFAGYLLADKFKSSNAKRIEKSDELKAAAADAIAKAEARGWYTVREMCEMTGGLVLAIGDRFRALTRDGDVIMIEVDERNDNPFFVSGSELQRISDFKLDDISDL